MSGIRFRGRKDHECLDASYYLYNGENLGDTSSWIVGDVVSVCFAISKKQTEMIRDNTDRYVTDDFVSVECRVVQRRHSIIWKSVGRFDALISCSMLLEAEDGQWEDVLRFITLGQLPAHWSA